jgi:hypothetical protein
MAANGNRTRPTIAVAYYAKLPTAPSSNDLGTGRVDHHVVLLLSQKFGETDADVWMFADVCSRTMSSRTCQRGYCQQGY